MDEKCLLLPSPPHQAPRLRRRAHLGLVIASVLVCLLIAAQYVTRSLSLGASPDIIAWQPCPDDSATQCGYLSVPLDWTDPHPNETVSIALRKLPAIAPRRERLGTLLINPGGPGGSGHASALRFGQNLATIVEGRYDILGFDPRGVNLTTPGLDCWAFEGDEQRAAYEELLLGLPLEGRNGRAKYETDQDMAYLRKVQTHMIKRAQNCRTNGNQKMLRSVSTAFVARDMKAIVEALGEEKLNLHAFSYGTILSATFAAMFPEMVGRIVADGVSDAQLYHEDHDAWSLNGMHDTNKTYDGFLSTCVDAREHCAFARPNSTIDELRLRIDKLIFDLIAHPLVVTHSQVGAGMLTATDVQLMIFHALYKPAFWPRTMQALHELEQGNGTMVLDVRGLGAAPIDHHRNQRPFHRRMSKYGGSDDTSAIMCSDTRLDKLNSSLESFARHGERLEAESLTGATWAIWDSPCRTWPFRAIERYSGPWSRADGLNKTHFPLLFVSNDADPVTPLVAAQKMSKAFDASLLVQRGFGHCSLAQPSMCTAKAIRSYFVDGDLPEYGKTCDSDLGFPYPSDKKILTLSADDQKLSDALSSLSTGLIAI